MSLHPVMSPLGKERDSLEKCKKGDYVLAKRMEQEADQFAIDVEHESPRWTFNRVALIGESEEEVYAWQRVT